jgi:hypothetical protein
MVTRTDKIEYLLYNSLTGEYVESLPFTKVSFSGGPVNSAGSFSGNLNIQDVGVARKNWGQSTKPNYNTLIIDLGGQIIWGGVISGRKPLFNEQGFDLEIDASEGLAWLQYWVQATDYSSPPYSGITGISGSGMPIWNKSYLYWLAHSGTPQQMGATYINETYGYQPYVWDPMLMGAQIIADKYAAEPANGIWGGTLKINLNGVTVCNFSQASYLTPPVDGGDHGLAYIESPVMTFDTNGNITSGISGIRTPPFNYVEINFPYTSLQTLQALVSQLTNLGYQIGFDAAVDFSYTDGKYSPIQATVNFSYPRRGAVVYDATPCSIPAGNAATLLLNPGNCHSWTFPEDGTTQGNTEYFTGGNQDIVVLENIYTEAGEKYGGYPNTDRVTNVANLNSPNPTQLLQAMADSALRTNSWPPVAPVIVTDAFDPNNGLGTFVVGDDCTAWMPSKDQDGNVFDPRFPQGLPPNEWRITQYQADIADEGESHCTFTMDTPPAQGYNFNNPILQGN